MHRMPQTMADPHKGLQPTGAAKPPLQPTAYVWLIKTQKCKCGNSYQSAQLLAETWLQSGGKPYANYRALGHEPPVLNLPIRNRLQPLEELPFCFLCSNEQTLAHLPKPSDDRKVVNHMYRAAPEAPLKAKPKAPKAPPTLDEIAKDLEAG